MIYKIVNKINSFLEYKKFIIKESLNKNYIPIGAATFDPQTIRFVYNSFNNNTINGIAFPCICFRPCDNLQSKYSIRSNRYLQYQILIQDTNQDIINLCHDIVNLFDKNNSDLSEILEDNWSSHTLNAIGYGFEYRLMSMEVMQITYFKKFINLDNLNIIEITIGLERLQMIIDNKYCNFDINNYKNIKDIDKIQQNFDYYNNMELPLLEIKFKSLLYKKNISYKEFLILNLIFNILDYHMYFNKSEKNIVMMQISNKIINNVFIKDEIFY